MATEIDDRDYRCLCSTHVRRGTCIICIFGIITNLCFVISCIFWGNVNLIVYILIIPFVISIVTHIILLIGNRKKRKAFYWPYLFLNAVLTIGFLILGIIACMVGSIIQSRNLSLYSLGVRHDQAELILVGGCVLLASVFIQIFFSYIIYRDYLYLQKVLLNVDSTLPRIS